MSNHQESLPANVACPEQPEGASLETELNVWLPVLPLLSRQLSDVISDMNTAIQQVCSRFQDVGINALQVAQGTIKAPELGKAVSQQLLHDLSLIVVALQFEDRLSQQVRHVARTLDQIHESLSAHLVRSADGEPTVISADRQHDNTQPPPRGEWGADPTRPSDSGQDVELF